MSKSTKGLVVVEYNPISFDEAYGSTKTESILKGCLGEVHKSLWEARKSGKGPKTIPVRFPLTLQNSRTAYHNGGYDPLDVRDAAEDSIELQIEDLYEVGRMPVSLYGKKYIKYPEDVKDLLGLGKYYYTNSLRKFLETLAYLGTQHKFCWKWKAEWKPASGEEPQPVFYEARFYGLDAVLNIYDKNSVSGVVIEVIVRPWYPKKERDGGSRISKLRNNVWVVSSSDEYIDYIDGVNLPRANDGMHSAWAGAVASTCQYLTMPREVIKSLRDVSGFKATKKNSKINYFMNKDKELRA